MIWYDMIYDMIWYDMIWYDMIWYDIYIHIYIAITPVPVATGLGKARVARLLLRIQRGVRQLLHHGLQDHAGVGIRHIHLSRWGSHIGFVWKCYENLDWYKNGIYILLLYNIITHISIWVCLKMLCTPLCPMVLLIMIPMNNGHFIGNINPTFSDKPIFESTKQYTKTATIWMGNIWKNMEKLMITIWLFNIAMENHHF